MTQPVLAFDTSGPRLSVGLWLEGQTLWEKVVDFPEGRLGHAAELVPAIAEGLARASLALDDLAYVALTIGPGSYTGLRIGLATAKGLALAREGLGLVGVGTLEAMAWPRLRDDRLVLAWIDARRGESFFAAYHGGMDGGRPAELLPPARAPLDEARRRAREAARRLGLDEVVEATRPPDVAAVAAVAHARWTAEGPDDLLSLLPLYVAPVHTGPVAGVAKP